MEPDKQLDAIRERIDEIDTRLLELISERARCARAAVIPVRSLRLRHHLLHFFLQPVPLRSRRHPQPRRQVCQIALPREAF